MDFELSLEHLAIRETVRTFTRREIAPRVEELDRSGEFPYAIVHKMSEMNFFGLTFPPEYGGVGAGSLVFVIMVEEIGWAESGVVINLVD